MANPGLDNSPIMRVVQTDVNGSPVYASGSITSTATTSQTLSGNNTTVTTPIFGVTGIVEILRLWLVVTTTLGSNHTAAAYRLNDQTAQVDITLNTGSTLSSFAAGSAAFKRGLVGTALTVINNSAGRANESTATNLPDWSPVILTKKTAATTNIEYVYATTNTPTTGVIQHNIEYRPLSADGAITVL